jgi:RNA polymerase sigma-70 factor (ECF subfamily)
MLYRIVQRHRSWTSRRTALTDEEANLDALPASPASGPERDLENHEAVRAFEAILDRLDPEKRAVLVLAEIEEKSLGEIAKILDLNANTVASRLRLARERVRAEIARQSARDGWRLK